MMQDWNWTRVLNDITDTIFTGQVYRPQSSEFVNPEVMFFNWTIISEPEPFRVHMPDEDSVEQFTFIPYVLEKLFSQARPIEVVVNEKTTLEVLAALDTAYCILIQEAAGNKSKRDILPLPRLEVIGAGAVGEALRLENYLNFMSHSVLEVVLSNHAHAAALASASNTRMIDFRHWLNLLQPASSVELTYADPVTPDIYLNRIAPVNRDNASDQESGFFKLVRLHNRVWGYPDHLKVGELTKPPANFAAAISFSKALLDYTKKLVTDDVVSEFENIIRWNQTLYT